MSDDHKEQHGDGSGGHEGGGHGHSGGGHAHGGGHEEGHEGAPEWLISFADNVALMMGFFVILLAMNMEKPTLGGIGGAGKFPADAESPTMSDFALAMREAFNNPVSIESKDPREATLVKRLKERKAKGETSKPGPDGSKHDVQAVRPSDYVNTSGFALFGDGSTTLSDESKRTISQVAEQLRGTRWIVEVRGHVSSVEAMRDKQRAVRLGFDRAYATADELVRQGVLWEQLRIVSCADNERVTPLPTDAAGHRNNQRAEIVVTQETVPPDPYSAGSSITPAPEHPAEPDGR